MAVCEACWQDAARRAAYSGRPVIDEYNEIIARHQTCPNERRPAPTDVTEEGEQP